MRASLRKEAVMVTVALLAAIPGLSAAQGLPEEEVKSAVKRSRDFLLEYVAHPSASVRELPAILLARAGDEQGIKALGDLLKVPAFGIDRKALSEIGDLGLQQYKGEIMKLTESKDLALRNAAWVALGKLGGEDVIRRLGEMMKSPDPREADLAAFALSDLKPGLSREYLLKRLAEDPTGLARLQIAGKLLARGPCPEAEAYVAKGLENAVDSGEQVVCLLVLCAWPARREAAFDKLVKMYGTLPDEERQQVVSGLGKVLWKNASDFIARLGLTDKSEFVRGTSCLALGSDPGAGPELTVMLRDEVPGVKAMAAEALGRVGDGGAIKSLAPLLAEEPKWVACEAAGAILRIEQRERTKKPPAQ